MSDEFTEKDLFDILPSSLKGELLEAFQNIVTNFHQNKWEPSELNGGKLCEIVYSILNGHVAGSYPNKSSKPRNMVDACNDLARYSTFPRSVRIQIPRVLIALYEIRNNRGVGHTGGDVNPNHMDSFMVLNCSKWIMAELVRLFHNTTTDFAREFIETLTVREIPTIWNIENKKRVLDQSFSMKEKTLLLLYHNSLPVHEKELLSWTEYSNASIFKKKILIPGHNERLWEYDKQTQKVTLSPMGVEFIELNLL